MIQSYHGHCPLSIVGQAEEGGGEGGNRPLSVPSLFRTSVKLTRLGGFALANCPAVWLWGCGLWHLV